MVEFITFFLLIYSSSLCIVDILRTAFSILFKKSIFSISSDFYDL